MINVLIPVTKEITYVLCSAPRNLQILRCVPVNPLTQIKLGARAQKNQIRQGPSCKKRDKPSGSESSHLHGHETGSSATSPPVFKSGRR